MFKKHRFMVARMNKTERGGVQQQPLRLRLYRRGGVQVIPQDRVAERLQMNPQLMGSAGDRPE